MNLRKYLWGDDALHTVCRLLVLESGAGLPRAASIGQVKALICQPGERQAEFLRRIRASLCTSATYVETAILCLNTDGGWGATLGRLALARSIVESAGPRTKVIIVAPEDNQSLELMVLIGLLRRQFPALNVSLQRASGHPITSAARLAEELPKTIGRSEVTPEAASLGESDSSTNTRHAQHDEEPDAGLAA